MLKPIKVWAAVLMLSLGLLSSCSSQDTIRIGAATYTETKIMAAIYKELIEDRTDISVDIIPDLLSTPMILNSMSRDDLDMALMYSGIIFNNFFPVKQTTDRESVLQQAQEGFKKYYDFTWFDPLGWENTYALTVREDVAKVKGLENVSDLKEFQSDMEFGVDSSWKERKHDGYPAFIKHYRFDFQNAYAMDINLVYEAVANQRVDVVLAYSTDPRLIEFDLKTLKDDKRFFPPYDASMVARNEVLEKNPELEKIMNELVGEIDEETITRLNYEVDINNRNEREVAREFLKEKGLLNK
ncbi:osmoprotectant ABC transporter substrate-binding protein [Bacillus canaveralius]|uniref:Osmoprotectant ABC transporter substrate-binding protein n=1 Tax=Bacillus canaveralius TaxID=1403243 RepID=A0A2N5GMC4_9BACI|nr:glycine betaine ABC transporter substrate-binding protein [Bacillus canaveralius]PLR82974.1 osmoprotectant ABC transporter substrate-binding protein [Bacillus canaveralius]PLR97022.1 osmoprotectant ABC transporter substrate-binding protein [Bacillus canaveralius]